MGKFSSITVKASSHEKKRKKEKQHSPILHIQITNTANRAVFWPVKTEKSYGKPVKHTKGKLE